MAQNEILVYLDGDPLADVYECFLNIRTEKTHTGFPVSDAKPYRITIKRRSRVGEAAFQWAMDSRPSNFKSGMFEFVGSDGEVFKKFEWDNGYVVDYKEILPDSSSKAREPMLEEFTIIAGEIRCEGASLMNNWSTT